MELEKNVTVIERRRVVKNYRVGIYARISTSSKEQLDSLSAQISGLTRMASSHPAWYVSDIFMDIGSAKTGSVRREFERMISECENNHIDIILTKSLSRFGRDTVETLEAIRRIRGAGKRIIFEQNEIDTESITDELLISVIEACEQAENEWRSENIKWGLRKRAQSGTSGLYNRPCYGFRKNKNGILEIEDEKAEVVRIIFDLYLAGKTAIGIKRELEQKGIKSPTGKDKWNKSTIEKIITNRKYTGDVVIVGSDDPPER